MTEINYRGTEISVKATPTAQAVLGATSVALERLDRGTLDGMIAALSLMRDRGGRLFIVGLGGGAGHASHAASDFRRLCGIQTCVLTDNVTELTASANDDGWEPIFVNWMSSLDFGVEDILLVFSVGGGMRSKVTGELVSGGIACAVMQAKALGARVLGVVGNPVGVTAEMADLCLLVRSPVAEYVTPVTEAVQSVVWHCLVTDSRLQRRPTKW